MSTTVEQGEPKAVGESIESTLENRSEPAGRILHAAPISGPGKIAQHKAF